MNDPKIISKTVKEIDPVEREFVQLSMGLAMKAKLALRDMGKTQGELAKELGKRESEVSRWFSGTHNLTLYSLAKLHVALGRKLFDIDILFLRPEETPTVVNTKEPTNVPMLKVVWPRTTPTGKPSAAA